MVLYCEDIRMLLDIALRFNFILTLVDVLIRNYVSNYLNRSDFLYQTFVVFSVSLNDIIII